MEGSTLNPLTQTELDHLSEIREVCQTVNSAGWRRILEQIKLFVEQSQEAMITAPYASDSVKAYLQTRWQQRVLMLRGIEQYIAACEEEKRILLEEVNQKRSVPPEYAEDREIA